MATDLEPNRDKQIARLEKLAAEVLKLKKDSRPKRPVIIEFCGSPKSGKTQAATSLTIFLKRNGFNVKVLTERASVSPVTDKRSPFFNMWTGCSMVTELIPYLSEPVTDVDVVIADRGVFDTLCWFTWLSQNGAISTDEHQEMVGFFMSKRFRQSTDLVLAFTASSEASMKREYAHLLTHKLGSIMAPGVLDSYVRSIEEAIREYGPAFKDVKSIDTSKIDQDAVAVDVTTKVLESMREELVEKVGVLSRSLLERLVPGQEPFELELLANAGMEIQFQPRTAVETDMDLVQLVPVVVVADAAMTQVMVFKKRSETLGKSYSPERDRNLLYVGGHMRVEDSFGLDTTDLQRISRVAIQREMFEELGTSLRLEDGGVFCIWDREGQKSSQKHLAIVHLAKVNFEEVRLRLDGYELVQPHNSEISGQVVDAQVAATWPAKSVESWSRVILQRMFRKEIELGPQALDFSALPD